MDVPILNKTIDDLAKDSINCTRNMFLHSYTHSVPDFLESTKLKLLIKKNDEYKTIGLEEASNFNDDPNLPELFKIAINIEKSQASEDLIESANKKPKEKEVKSEIEKAIDSLPKTNKEKLSKIPKQFLLFEKKKDTPAILSIANSEMDKEQEKRETVASNNKMVIYDSTRIGGILSKKIKKLVKPEWHAPWKLMRVISGHQGWVRSIAVDHSNQWFVTGSNDRTIKFWDMASGTLKLTLTGHINAVRGLAISPKHVYLFSCSEDKTVRCWDLEYNKAIRSYHGHLSGVYCLSLHPTLDILATGGRDSTVRIWDIRTRAQIHVLSGHSHVVSSLVSQEFEPQIISGSHDNMVRCWDLAMGKTVNVLTNHKKSIRSLVLHPTEYSFCSGAADNLKVWKCPEGTFLRNISGHNAIVNCMALNRDNVLVSGGDNGYNFQQIKSQVQPGSISAEAGIFAAAFDKSSLRLITGECDKTIKIWKEDEEATPETHPIDDIRIPFDDAY